MNMDSISTRQLAEALARRADLEAACVRSDGLLDPLIWPLRVALGAVACVDGIGVRRRASGTIEGGIIRRATGRFPGKLSFVGGVVAKYESREAALRRHFGTDLGIEIDFLMGPSQPVEAAQYASQVDGENRRGFGHDPGKHSIADTFLVGIASTRSMHFGATDYGGQEASGFEWYTIETCPPESDWSYGMRRGFIFALECAAWERDIGRINIPAA